jgi:hypothetical protein
MLALLLALVLLPAAAAPPLARAPFPRCVAAKCAAAARAALALGLASHVREFVYTDTTITNVAGLAIAP